VNTISQLLNLAWGAKDFYNKGEYTISQLLNLAWAAKDFLGLISVNACSQFLQQHSQGPYPPGLDAPFTPASLSCSRACRGSLLRHLQLYVPKLL
jgi:hypothetical protein